MNPNNIALKKYLMEYDDGTVQKFWNIDVLPWGATVEYGIVGGEKTTEQLKYDNELVLKAEVAKLIDKKYEEGYVEIIKDLHRGVPYYELDDYISKNATWFSKEAVVRLLHMVRNKLELNDTEKQVVNKILSHSYNLYVQIRYTGISFPPNDSAKHKLIADCSIDLQQGKVVLNYCEPKGEYIHIEKSVTPAFETAITEFFTTYKKQHWLDKTKAKADEADRKAKEEKWRKALVKKMEKCLIDFWYEDGDKLELEIIKLYGGSKRDHFPYREMLDNELLLLLECLKNMPAQKASNEALLTNFYKILLHLNRKLSLKGVKELFHMVRAEGKIPDVRTFYLKDEVNEAWNDRSLMSIEAKIHSKKLDDVRPILEKLLDNIDNYITAWRFDSPHIHIEKLDENSFPCEERGFMRIAGNFKELIPLVEQYADKLLEAFRVYQLYQNFSNSTQRWRYYIGTAAMAVAAKNNPAMYDAKLCEFMQLIVSHTSEHLYRAFSDVLDTWGKDSLPDLQLTFAKFPQLKNFDE